MNRSHTDQLSAAMRGSRGGGGGGVHVNLTKKNSDSVVCLFLSPRLILQKSNG